MVVWITLIIMLTFPARALPPREVDAASPAQTAKWPAWTEFGGAFGSDNSERGEVAIFVPVTQSDNSILFTEFRGKLFENDVREGNFALGYRKMRSSGWNLGIWGGFDIRATEEDNKFFQIAGGLEALSERWDLRANAYIPVTDPEASPGLATVFLRGNQILMTGGEEMALYGVDGEIGYRTL